MAATNREGLTLDEWWRAAHHGHNHRITPSVGRVAWAKGEDPTEWAAYYGRKEVVPSRDT